MMQVATGSYSNIFRVIGRAEPSGGLYLEASRDPLRRRMQTIKARPLLLVTHTWQVLSVHLVAVLSSLGSLLKGKRWCLTIEGGRFTTLALQFC